MAQPLVMRDPQDLLEDIFHVPVHFQPPPGVFLTYPCILYNLADIHTKKANDKNYIAIKRYSLTIIDINPDSPLVEIATEKLPMNSFDRTFYTDGLNHWVYTFYY